MSDRQEDDSINPLARVGGCPNQNELKDYHLLPTVRGDLFEKLGGHDEARAEFERAASLTKMPVNARSSCGTQQPTGSDGRLHFVNTMSPVPCRTRAPFTLLFVCLIAANADAQTPLATIRGRIFDQQRAAVPGASLTVRSTDTNLVTTVTTDSSGNYFVPNLPAGTYELAVAHAGFVTSKREALILAVGEHATIDVTLQVEGVTQVVTVQTDTGRSREATTHVLGTTIGSRQIDNLPSVSRSFSDLAMLVPGVLPGFGGNGDTLAFNGQRGYANGVFVDGASNEMQYYGSPFSSFPLDWLQEFQVMTGGFDAQWGTASGGILNVVTRSGSNRFSGRAYGFVRNDAWDAAPYAGHFENGKPAFERDAPPLDQRRWGAFLGGPLVRGRLFFFSGFEDLDSKSSTVLGISSYWRAQGLKTVVPATATDLPAILKTDMVLGSRHRASLRVDRSKRVQTGRGDALDTDERRQTFGGQAYDVLVNWTAVLGERSVNDSRVFFGSDKPPLTCAKSGAGGPAQLTLAPPGTYASIRFPGANFGCPVFTGLEGEQNLHLLDHYTTLWGAHQFDVGGQASRLTTIDRVVNFHDGQWTHSTDVVFDRNNPISWPDAFTANRGGTGAVMKTWAYAFFVQDAWRLRDTLTLSLGLRYDVDRSVDGVNGFVDAKNSRVVSELGGEPPLIKTAVDTNNWAPRAGLTWKPALLASWTLRGSAGLFYDQPHGNSSAIYLINSLLSDRFVSLDANTPALNPFYDPADPARSRQTLRAFLARNYPLFPDLSFAPQVKGGLASFDPHLQVPFTRQYTAGGIYEPTPNLSMRFDYVHTRGEDQLVYGDRNAVLSGNQIIRPDTRFLNKGTLQNLGWIRYDGLQTEVRYDDRTLHSRVSYTLSGTTSNVSSTIFGGAPTKNALIDGAFDLSEDEGPDNADRRHSLIVDWAWRVPFDMQLSGIWTLRSGAPWSVTTTQQLDTDPFVDRPEPRNSRRGDAFDSVDMRVMKTVRLGSKTRASVFWELFNALNTTNFSTYAGSLQSSSFGMPIAAYEKRRQQLGIRVEF